MGIKTLYKRVFLLVILLVFGASLVMAAGEIRQTADRLNYWISIPLTVTVVNTGILDTSATISSPWTVTATTFGCTNIANVITCDLAAGVSGTYTVTADGSVGEYATQAFILTTNNSYTSETVKFIRMQDTEIFRTLVEYGRGRGDYFYDSGTNRKGVQCTDLPAYTDLELNYLHKIYPVINTYLNLPSAEGTNVSIYCTYPNETVPRQHLVTNIIVVGGETRANYTSDWLKNSWEKVFFLVQDFDATSYAPGNIITISCTDMQYYLSEANGWVVVDSDTFNLTFRNSTPLTITASSDPATIGIGTSEVVITYTITNTETMTLSSSSYPVSIDIKAPTDAEFIGVRAEMWGTAQKIYHYEINQLASGESTTITLVAKYTTVTNGTTDLSAGASVSYVPCWQINAYNPQTVDQSFGSMGVITVSTVSVTTMNLQTEITSIQAKLDALNLTALQINATVNDLNTYLVEINTTTLDTNSFLKNEIETKLDQINGTVNNIDSTVAGISITVGVIQTTINDIQTTVSQINTTVNTNGEVLLQVNGTLTSLNDFVRVTIENKLDEINVTTQYTKVVVDQINTSTNSVLVTVTDINSSVNSMQFTINDINSTVTDNNIILNQLNITANNIYTGQIEILNVVNFINTTQLNMWENVTATDIYNLINSVNTTVSNLTINLDTSSLTTQMTNLNTNVRQLREFSEESIYLITDSITEGQASYKEALQALSVGDKDKAVAKLQESLDKLTTVQKAIVTEQAKTEGLTVQQAANQSLIGKILGWLGHLFGGK